MGCYKPSNVKEKEIENEIKFNKPIIIEKFGVNPQIFESIESEQKEIKNYLQNIKSKYILKQIFNYLQKKNQLKIMKYNNKIKERLNINLVDYKNYSDIIEIDIIPVDNNYGKFINILKLKEKPYFHIFFNDSKKEINRNYLTEDDNVTKIKIRIDKEVKSLVGLFHNCEYIESINFIKFCRNDINNMSNMFFNCSSLKKINLSNFNTENVIYMSNMFYGCSNLEELNLSNFNTENVVNMSYMFYGCRSLKELNVSNFKTSNVIDMTGMFENCSSLLELNLTNFNINKVKYKKNFIDGCSSLKKYILA